MRRIIWACAFAFALGGTAAAQDSTVKSKTQVKGDDAKAVTIQGCLQRTQGGNFMLLGDTTASGKELTAKNTVKTDVDGDKTKVESNGSTKVEKGDHKVATSGSSYLVTPHEGVDLAAHAGQQVELTAVMIDARKGGDKTADVKIKENTHVDREDAPDSNVKSQTKAEVPRGATSQLMAMSVKSLGRNCAF
ncbi:MAG TPA: hypothetical protein VL173_04150 [Vicinamibacterales bacterium]|nr:hypothetical protein [Vicinamibacterales bacterium]